MSDRGYMLLEVPVTERLLPDQDLIVRVIEYVRLNLGSFAPRIPVECEVDILAAGTAHNIDPRPVLGLHAPPSLAEALPDWLTLHKAVSDWCDRHSDEELRTIGRATEAPTWGQLQTSGIHPLRR